MNSNFKYSLTPEDYIKYEKIKIRQRRTSLMLYISCLVLLAIGTFNAVNMQDYTVLLLSVAYIIMSAVSVIYESRIKPARDAKRYIALDKGYLAERELTLTLQSIEFTVSCDDGTQTTGVYPWQAVSAVLETKEYFQIIMATEYYLLPKGAIPEGERENVANILRARPNYLNFKKL